MVKLTLDLIVRGTSRSMKKKKDESKHQFVRRITHLYLENKNIHDVGDDLCLCRSLMVLYLYDNNLTRAPCLSNNGCLTHLYLQNNNISKIENLSSLDRLQKLYLGGNTITVLEGLEKLQQLQELYVENQQLPHGEHLLFDPRSLEALSESLQVLNVSGNNLPSIAELEKLPKLTQLMASNNQLWDMKEMIHLLSLWRFLWRLDLAGNPVCQAAKYKDKIIVNAANLELLDGRTVTTTARQFLLNWQHARDLQMKKSQENLSRQETFSSFSSETVGGGGRTLLPALSGRGRPASYSAHLMPGLPRKQFNALLSKYNLSDPAGICRVQSGSLETNVVGPELSSTNHAWLGLHKRAPRPLSVERVHLNHSAYRRRL